MKHDYLKYYNSKISIYLIGILLLAAYLAKDYWHLSISIFAIVFGMMIFISTHLWKYKPFSWLFWIDDFSGRYEGIVSYQFRDESGNIQNGELKHVKVISQNGHRISVSSFTIKLDGERSSSSLNKGMYVEKTEDERHYRLIYNYLNEGSQEQGFPPHYGTEIIKFIKRGEEKVLSGKYYTNREPYQTKGEFSELKWVSNDPNHEF